MCLGEQLIETVDTAAADGSINVLLSNHDVVERTYKQGEVIGSTELVEDHNLFALTDLKVEDGRDCSDHGKWKYLRSNIKHGFRGAYETAFWQLIFKYRDVFSKDKYDLG